MSKHHRASWQASGDARRTRLLTYRRAFLALFDVQNAVRARTGHRISMRRQIMATLERHFVLLGPDAILQSVRTLQQPPSHPPQRLRSAQSVETTAQASSTHTGPGPGLTLIIGLRAHEAGGEGATRRQTLRGRRSSTCDRFSKDASPVVYTVCYRALKLVVFATFGVLAFTWSALTAFCLSRRLDVSTRSRAARVHRQRAQVSAGTAWLVNQRR